jgi:hypothetical protein
MATTKVETRPLANSIPKRGPVWTFYVWTVFALLVAVATVVGFQLAGAAHWF